MTTTTRDSETTIGTVTVTLLREGTRLSLVSAEDSDLTTAAVEAAVRWASTVTGTRLVAGDAAAANDRVDGLCEIVASLTAVRLTPWQTLTLTDSTRDVPATSARGIIALDEYRRTGSMAGYWPCDTEELAALDEVAAVDAGLSVEAIDWTGLPTADDVQRLRRRLRHMPDCLAPLSPAELADAVAD